MRKISYDQRPAKDVLLPRSVEEFEAAARDNVSLTGGDINFDLAEESASPLLSFFVLFIALYVRDYLIEGAAG